MLCEVSSLPTSVRWVAGALAVVAVLDVVALGLAAREGDRSALWVVVPLVVCGLVWEIVDKLTSTDPVDVSWGFHLRFVVFGSLVLVLGLAGAVLGGLAGAWGRPLGVLGVVLGGLMLVAGQRDFDRWRAAVDDERHRSAVEARPATGRRAW